MVDEMKSDNVHLQLKTTSIRNNSLECDSLGIFYQISTDTSGIHATRSTNISKWIPSTDDKAEEDLLLAEWKRKNYNHGEVKLYGLAPPSSSPDFIPLKEFIYRQHLSTFLAGSNIFDRSFVANNGKTYTWKSRSKYMKLYCNETDKEIASYYHYQTLFNKRNGSLELIDDWKDILDYIVVTFVIVEKLRREEERNESTSN